MTTDFVDGLSLDGHDSCDASLGVSHDKLTDDVTADLSELELANPDILLQAAYYYLKKGGDIKLIEQMAYLLEKKSGKHPLPLTDEIRYVPVGKRYVPLLDDAAKTKIQVKETSSLYETYQNETYQTYLTDSHVVLEYPAHIEGEDDKENLIISSRSTYLPKNLQQSEANSYQNVTNINNTDNCYRMESFPRGTMTIFNMRDFKEKESCRDGTDEDAANLTLLFLKLGFIVDRYNNTTKEQMLSALKSAAKEGGDCWACVVLSHGGLREKEGIIYVVDGDVRIRDITCNIFEENLAGKPKLYIINACRGRNMMEPIPNSDKIIYDYTTDNDALTTITLPKEADFVYAYSTVIEYLSHRVPVNGTWFIQTICSIFRKYARTTDLGRMFTRVNEELSKMRGLCTKGCTKGCTERCVKGCPEHCQDLDQHGSKQIASIVSQLRKDLYFPAPYAEELI